MAELVAANALYQEYSGSGWLYRRAVDLLTQVVATRTTLHGEIHKSTQQAVNLLGVAKELVKLEQVRMKAFYLAQEQKLPTPVPSKPQEGEGVTLPVTVTVIFTVTVTVIVIVIVIVIVKGHYVPNHIPTYPRILASVV